MEPGQGSMREQMGGAATQTSGMQRMQVTKSDGRTEPFDPDKIIRSITSAGATEAQAHQIAMHIERSNRPMMTTSEIGHMVMNHLEKMNPDAHQHWMEWKQEHKKQ